MPVVGPSFEPRLSVCLTCGKNKFQEFGVRECFRCWGRRIDVYRAMVAQGERLALPSNHPRDLTYWDRRTVHNSPGLRRFGWTLGTNGTHLVDPRGDPEAYIAHFQGAGRCWGAAGLNCYNVGACGDPGHNRLHFFLAEEGHLWEVSLETWAEQLREWKREERSKAV